MLGQQLGRFANEAEQALAVPIGSPEEAGVLRSFVQVISFFYRTFVLVMDECSIWLWCFT
jgi:hypothetical protein